MLTFTFTIWPLLAHTTKFLWESFTNSYFQKVSKFNFQILWGADDVALKCLPQLAGHQVPKKSSLPQMSHYLTVLLKYLNICTFPLPDVPIFWYFSPVRYFDIWNPLSRCEAVLAACQSYLLSTPGWIFKIHTDPCFTIDFIDQFQKSVRNECLTFSEFLSTVSNRSTTFSIPHICHFLHRHN